MFYDCEFFAANRPVLLPLATPLQADETREDMSDYVIKDTVLPTWQQTGDKSGVYLESEPRECMMPEHTTRPAPVSTDFGSRYPLRARLMGANDEHINDCVYSAQAKFDAPLEFTDLDDRPLVIKEEMLTYYENSFSALPFDSTTATLSNDGRSQLVTSVEVCMREDQHATARLTLAVDAYTVNGLKIKLTQSIRSSLGKLTFTDLIVPTRYVHRASWDSAVVCNESQKTYSVHVAFSRQRFPAVLTSTPVWTMEVSCADRIDGITFYEIFTMLLKHYAYQYINNSGKITPVQLHFPPFDHTIDESLLANDESSCLSTSTVSSAETTEWLHELVRYMGLETIMTHVFSIPTLADETEFKVSTTKRFERLDIESRA